MADPWGMDAVLTIPALAAEIERVRPWRIRLGFTTHGPFRALVLQAEAEHRRWLLPGSLPTPTSASASASAPAASDGGAPRGAPLLVLEERLDYGIVYGDCARDVVVVWRVLEPTPQQDTLDARGALRQSA